MNQPQPAQTPLQAPRRSSALKWILIILMIVILGSGGYFAINYSKSKKDNVQKTPEESNKIGLGNSYNEISSYLSFQYPLDWGVLAFDQGKTIYLSPKLNEFLEKEKEGGGESLVRTQIMRGSDPVIKLSLIDVKYSDSKSIISNFCETEIIEDPASGLKADIKTEDKEVESKVYKYISYDTPIPEQVKPYVKDNTIRGTDESYSFPQYRLYYGDLDKYMLITALVSLDVEKHEDSLQSILSSVKINKPNVELKSYDQFGLKFQYPALWKLDEEWTGRNNNLGEVDLWSNLTQYESANDKSIRMSVRLIGKSEGTPESRIINPQWNSTDIVVDGHSGKRYTYTGTRMYQGETTQEHILFQINDKYEIDIYNEDAEVHKYVLDGILNGLQIDVAVLSAKADEVLSSSPYK